MTKKSRKPMTKKSVAKPCEPTPYERERMDTYFDNQKENPLPPRMKVFTKDGVKQFEPDHPVPTAGVVLLMEAFATRDAAFLGGLLTQLANAGTQGTDVDERGVNFMLSVVEGIKPKDPSLTSS